MTLQEAETKLAGLNEKIDTLLKERESILKEWDIAFHAENPENIKCIDENIGDSHNLYLVNGDSKMNVCHFGNYEMNGSIDDFYKSINNSMCILNIANKRNDEMPDYQKNLVYAKSMEIRKDYQKKAASELLHILSESEKDVETSNVASMQGTMEELRNLLLMRNTKS